MKTSALMIPDPITIGENATIREAIEVMKVNSIRHLPVVAEGNRLAGFVTLADLKQGLIPSMLGDLTLADLMIRSPITVQPDDDIEIAAQRIYKHKIGGMPVVKDNRIVGIITETDIFKAFLELLGAGEPGVRITMKVPEGQGMLPMCTETISKLGGSLLALVTWGRDEPGERTVTVRVSGVDPKKLKEGIAKLGVEFVDVRGS